MDATRNLQAGTNMSLRPVLRVIIQAAWRRRWLLLIPFLIMLPVGFAASKLMPLNYVSRSLMLLQESGETGPLTREAANAQFMTNEERLAALRALLLSDHVLVRALDDLGITDATARAAKVRQLRDTFWLEGAGTNFIEIFHSGSNPAGLGEELEIVVLRFLEALLPEQDGPNAAQLLLEKHSRDLARQKAVKASLARSLAQSPFVSLAAAQASLTERRRRLDEANERLRQTHRAVEQAARKAGLSGITTAEELDAELARLMNRNRSIDAAQGQEVSTEDVAALRQALDRRKSAAAEQADAAAAVEAERRAVSSYESWQASLAEADRKIASFQSQLKSAQRRLDAIRLMHGEGVLRAPELIRIIDPPRDPQFPTRSPMIYLVAALAASALLGLGLAVIAEFLDTRLRDPEQFSDVAGAPVIARIGSRAASPTLSLHLESG